MKKMVNNAVEDGYLQDAPNSCAGGLDRNRFQSLGCTSSAGDWAENIPDIERIFFVFRHVCAVIDCASQLFEAFLLQWL